LLRPGVFRQGLLAGHRAGQGIAWALESDEKSISRFFDLVTTEAMEDAAQQRVVTEQRSRKDLATPLPLGGGPLDVRQQKRHRARGRPGRPSRSSRGTGGPCSDGGTNNL